MSQTSLEQALRDLPRVGRLVKHRPRRDVWRFEVEGKPYYLYFHPSPSPMSLSRRLAGSPALSEFTRLQWLQKAGVPAPRAIATLMGFSIDGRRGDAVVVEAIEPSLPLDQYFNNLELEGRSSPRHWKLIQRVIDLLEKMGRAELGHGKLSIGDLLVRDDQVYLLGASSVHKNGLRLSDLQRLELSARPHATRTDLQRAWKRLGPGGRMPPRNPLGPRVWRKASERAFEEGWSVGELSQQSWNGFFFKQTKLPRRWSPASKLEISESDWQKAFPLMLQQIESGQFEVLKVGPSADVFAGEVILGGRPVSVVVKRPKRKFWYRYINEIGRGSRSRRAWKKAWQLIVRSVPTAWPMLLMERRVMGYVVDSMLVCEKIEGKTLSTADLKESLGPCEYHRLLHRCGALLRRLEQGGLFLYDAKADNWIVREDEQLGPVPLLVDVDSVRWLRPRGGLQRLLRSLREDQAIDFTPADADALVRGYTPFGSEQQRSMLHGMRDATNGQAPPPRPAPATSASSVEPGRETEG